MAIVPDNLKSAVTRSDRNEPVINEEFAAFAEFYDMAVFPARVRHPKDKALVENAVKHDALLCRYNATMAAIRQRPYPFLFVGTYREALTILAA